jgi:TonB-like protein
MDSVNERRIIQGAFGISLVVHLLFAVATWKLPFLEVDLSQAQSLDQEVEFYTVPEDTPDPAEADKGEEPEESEDPNEPDTSSNWKMPTDLSMVPDRLASEIPPDNPDYLASFHSIAADNVLGGYSSSPIGADDGDQGFLNQVAIREEDLSGAPGVAFFQQTLPDPEAEIGPLGAGTQGDATEEAQGENQGTLGEWALPDEAKAAGQQEREGQEAGEKQPELAEWWDGQVPSVLREGPEGATGDRGFEFNQDSSGMSGAGVAIDGDFSLNTYAWNYGPWMKRFSNQLYRVWMAPYAYRVGIISGKTVIRVVIEKDGFPSSMEILETEGHDSLHEASLAAMKAFAPYAPLPGGFPEERLVIKMVLLYPDWKR